VSARRCVMINLLKTARLAAIFVALWASTVFNLRAAQPENYIHQGQGVETELGADASAITYWVAESDGLHVVTTIDIVLTLGRVARNHAVARVSAVLLPGQVQIISVPYPLGEQQQVLRIRRLDDRIEIALVAGSST
jgi:hypothetical protein